MGEGYNFKNLSAHIIKLSIAKDWPQAKLEWELFTVWDSEEPTTCPCGHYPIMERCTIANRLNGKMTEVGNVCVKKFMNIRADQIFASVKRIKEDNDKSLSAQALDFFHQRSIISKKDYDFSLDTLRKRNLSEKQLDWRHGINAKVLRAVKKDENRIANR